MDSYGQIGPEKGSYAQDVRIIARKLARATVFVALADRSTRYELMLGLRDSSFVIPGAAPSGVPRDEHYIYVSSLTHGAYWFRLDTYASPEYIAAKLNLTAGDGEIIGEFLTRLGAELLAQPDQGARA